MKMILLQDVKSVGKKGDLINASEGYAKNFLLPRKLAVEATKSNLNDYELKQKAEAKRKQEELEKAQATAKELEDKVVTIKAAARASDRSASPSIWPNSCRAIRWSKRAAKTESLPLRRRRSAAPRFCRSPTATSKCLAKELQ